MTTRLHRVFIQAIPLLFVFLWSTGFIGAKYALPFIEPFYLLFIRMLWTIAVFLLLCVVLRVQWPSWQQAGHQMVTGLLLHGLYLGGVFAAIKWGMPAGITAIVVGIQPLLTAVLGWRLFGERLLPRQWLGLALGLIGVTVVILSTRGYGNFDFAWSAIAASLIALAAIVMGTVYQKRFGGGVNLVAGSLWQYVSTALFMGLLAYSFETRVVVWDKQLIFALAWLVLGLSVSAILLLMYMIREGEAAKVASYFYLVPPATSIEAWLLFDESLPLLAMAAIALTVAGVYLVVKKT
ncbi:DMT family transporter [uncultured Thiothrix sp.]|uniref:DMT family transporter n=1 Tax=uncultured Thiothrix sp. TaxID=223185 RepID=UPI0026074BF4|nr:DMT family transporter [uncultured Thiothrix sp.]HMT93170.1 DMT family transporter [Thiolinea sp.]